jgi:hypothetical protein
MVGIHARPVRCAVSEGGTADFGDSGDGGDESHVRCFRRSCESRPTPEVLRVPVVSRLALVYPLLGQRRGHPASPNARRDEAQVHFPGQQDLGHALLRRLCILLKR